MDEKLNSDIRRLVIAARTVAFEDQGPDALRELDLASEAFARLVPWENEEESPECPSCHGLNTSCPEGCGRDSKTGELNGTTLARTPSRNDVLEEAALAAESYINNAEDWDSSYWDQCAESIAAAIRARKDQEHG